MEPVPIGVHVYEKSSVGKMLELAIFGVPVVPERARSAALWGGLIAVNRGGLRTPITRRSWVLIQNSNDRSFGNTTCFRDITQGKTFRTQIPNPSG